MKRFLLVLMLLYIVPMLGCKLLVSPIEPLVPQAPEAAATPSVISNLTLSPSQIQAGVANPVSVAFDYEDLNADVDSGTADIEVTVGVSVGSFLVDSTPQLAPGLVEPEQAHWGRKGRVKLTRLIHLPQDADGVISVRFVLIDAAGQRSNALTGELRILPAETKQGGGVGPGGERCTVLDGDRNPVTLVRIGRQVLFRIEDEDNNFSSDRQDRLFRVAALQASSSGDVEVIDWMLETGTNTGVFEGPAAGILLTSRFPVINNGELSVLDNDTILAHYEDPNSPGDMCIAIAKVL